MYKDAFAVIENIGIKHILVYKITDGIAMNFKFEFRFTLQFLHYFRALLYIPDLSWIPECD
jgi:hypothetical protein